MDLFKFYTDKNQYLSFLPPADWISEASRGDDPRTKISFFHHDEHSEAVASLTISAYHAHALRSDAALKHYFKQRMTFLYQNTACSAAPVDHIILGDISCLFAEVTMNTTQSMLFLGQHDSGLCIDIAYSAADHIFDRYKHIVVNALKTIVILKNAYHTDRKMLSEQNTYLLKKEIALLLAEEKYMPAYEILQALITERTDDCDLYFQMGLAQAGLNFTDQALCFFAHALDLKPDFWQVLFQMGKLQARVNRLEQAEESFLEVLSLQPDSINTLLNLAIIYSRQGKLRKAIKTYKKIIRSIPENMHVLADMGKAYYELGKFDHSRKWYEKCVKLDASNPQILVELARCYLALTYTAEAEIFCKKALSLDPNLYLAHKILHNIRELSSNK